ncbi:negative growth regulatory protein [Scheffersomyces amazonensis]|uniref:negative growth regulatory protein n=1 Tax=Scheffersomyces amazonensis TaxID=1078765 RepID=UPI00315C9196
MSYLETSKDDSISYKTDGNNSVVLETAPSSESSQDIDAINSSNIISSPPGLQELPSLPKTNISGPTILPINADTATSNTVSHQHHKEQEMLSGFAIPAPPISTQQSSVAAERERGGGDTTSSSGISGEIDHPRTLWMGDLDPWLDEQGIVELWWKILQKRVDVKIIKPKSSKPDTNYQGLSHSGYCFVEFESYEDAQKALGLNGQLLPDIAMPSQKHFPNNPDNQKKYFRLNWASGATLNAPIVQTPEYSLFVGDLSASTTEAHLLAFFQKKYPSSIKTVRVMTDPVSGKSRCFGFVRFTDESERQRALTEMNGVWFGGRPLRVALATPRTTGRKFGGGPSDASIEMGGYYTNNPDPQQNMMYLGGPGTPSGIPPQQSQQQLQPPPQQLGQLGQLVTPNPGGSGPNYGPGPGGPSPFGAYYGTPQLPPPHGVGSPYDLQQEGNINYDGQIKSPLPLPIPPAAAAAVAAAAIQNQSFSDPNNTTVFVGGLSSEVNEPTLFTLFKPFGLIQQVKIPPGKNCGFIKYSTREEAEEAIAAMQGFIISGNRVRLSWGRVSLNNKKFQQQHQQVAQAAAAALSMGLDPASAMAAAAAAAAGGYGPPPPGPHQLGGVPPPHHGPPPLGIHTGPPPMPHSGSYGSQDYDISHNSDNSGSYDDSGNSPQYYLQLGGSNLGGVPPPHHLGSPGTHEDLQRAMRNLNLDNSGSSGGGPIDDRGGANYMIPPPNMYGPFGMPDLSYQQFIPSHMGPAYNNGSPSPTSTPYNADYSQNQSQGQDPNDGPPLNEEGDGNPEDSETKE